LVKHAGASCPHYHLWHQSRASVFCSQEMGIPVSPCCWQYFYLAVLPDVQLQLFHFHTSFILILGMTSDDGHGCLITEVYGIFFGFFISVILCFRILHYAYVYYINYILITDLKNFDDWMFVRCLSVGVEIIIFFLHAHGKQFLLYQTSFGYQS
jgi:hypothetical protein